MPDSTSSRPAAALLDFINRSKSPWHAAANMAEEFEAAGYSRLREEDSWSLSPGRGYYVLRDGSSIIAFHTGAGDPSASGFRIAGAHTDSPGFRVKPKGGQERGGHAVLGVEIYGGPLLATFADRDLTLAGRVVVEDVAGELEARLVDFRRPLVRLPNVAIHMNRGVNEQGLRFDPQEELPLVLASLQDGLPAHEQFRNLLAAELQCSPGAIVAWELAVADTQGGAFFGPAEEFIASPQLDNLASCHAAMHAQLAAGSGKAVSVLACFDHEEVGSQSYKGAEGSFLPDTLARIARALGLQEEAYRRGLARSLVLSCDMAHAYHPNFARLYDDQHVVRLNQGPVIKINAKERYATDGLGEAYVRALSRRAGVAIQEYVHRNDLPCGSTIGPITAARLGVRTVDIGNPMWSMHSIRETAGAHDHADMIKLLTAFFGDADLPFGAA